MEKYITSDPDVTNVVLRCKNGGIMTVCPYISDGIYLHDASFSRSICLMFVCFSPITRS